MSAHGNMTGPMVKSTPSRSQHARPTKGPQARHLRQVAFWAQGGVPEMMLKGIRDYIAAHPALSLSHRWFWELSEADWPAWKGDGVVTYGDLKPLAHVVERMRIPMVAICPLNKTHLPSVLDDDAAIGILAAEHLLERGLKHFGVCSSAGAIFSDTRREAFVRRVKQAGHSCAVYNPPHLASANVFLDLTAQWLAKTPKPAGILAVSFFHAQELLAACHRQGLAIPDDVAIISVNEDDPAELLDHHPISYVRLNSYRLGIEAATLLDRLMSGNPVTTERITLIPPLCVETRLSTDILAIPDLHVTTTLRYIQQHACEGIRLADLFKSVSQSKRVFVYRFRRLVGRTPHEEILRVQMNHVKNLLTNTDLSLQQITERTGFYDVAFLIRRFRREMGTSPAKYRKQIRTPRLSA